MLHGITDHSGDLRAPARAQHQFGAPARALVRLFVAHLLTLPDATHPQRPNSTHTALSLWNSSLAGGGTIYGMHKTTVYLPESIKSGVEREARLRSCSEAEVIRQAVADAVSRPVPRPGIIPGDSA